MQKFELKIPKDKTKIIVYSLIGIAGVIGIVFAYKFIKKLTDAIDVTDTKEERKDDKNIKKELEKGVSSAFSPLYYKTPQISGYTLMLLNQAKLKDVSDEIMASFSIWKNIFQMEDAQFNNNKERLFAAIKRIGYKTQLSQLSEYMAKNEKMDLLTQLKSVFSEDTLLDQLSSVTKSEFLNDVFVYANKLPSGFIAPKK